MTKAYFKKVKVLVTGVAGFIGFHLARQLLQKGHEVVGLDNLNDYYEVRLKEDRLRNLGVDIGSKKKYSGCIRSTKNSGLRFARIDLTDRDGIREIIARERCDSICHLAAQAGVRHSLSDPWSYTANNIDGFLSILEAVRWNPIQHLVYASSSSVYGLDHLAPFSESTAADHPISLYAASKRANELMAHSYSHLFGMPTTGLRFFTVYGPWGRPDMALFIFTKAILKGRQIDLFNYGNMSRDFTYVDDVIEAIKRVIEKPPNGLSTWDGIKSSVSPAAARVLNVGRGYPEELGQLVSILEDEIGIKANIKKVPLPPGDVAKTWADCRVLKEEFDFEPKINIREGVKEFVSWYRNYYSV